MQQNSMFSAVVLVGGQSRRMGYPKYLAKIGGQTVLRRQLEILSTIFPEIILVTNTTHYFRERPGVKIVTDLVANKGPMGGLFTGLKAASGDGIFLVGCDMPFLESKYIEKLIVDFDCRQYDGRIPISSKGLEPLHAVYSKRMLRAVEASIGAKDLSMKQLIQNSNCQTVDWSCQQTNIFLNVNTPEELERAKSFVSLDSQFYLDNKELP